MVSTDIEPSSNYYYRAMDIENPGEVNVLGFYLNSPIQDETMGASLYISKPPHENVELEFIGAVANSRPSDIFHTGWAINPSVNVRMREITNKTEHSAIGNQEEIRRK